jgi:hypothetical protein
LRLALANAGHDTRAIQDWLGHRAIQHTARYTELSDSKIFGAPDVSAAGSRLRRELLQIVSSGAALTCFNHTWGTLCTISRH